MDIQSQFIKLRNHMRHRLIGMAGVDARFRVSLSAFNTAERIYEGHFRKDKVTPAFMHPLGIMLYHTTLLPSLRHPAETLATDALHDCVEDYGMSVERVRDEFGKTISHAVMRVSKVIHGIKVASLPEHFELMLDCPIATVAKPGDRINNQSTMHGVFSSAKQLEYIEETERFILPMLKKARHLYPDQESVYENMKFVLRSQAAHVLAMHGNKTVGA